MAITKIAFFESEGTSLPDGRIKLTISPSTTPLPYGFNLYHNADVYFNGETYTSVIEGIFGRVSNFFYDTVNNEFVIVISEHADGAVDVDGYITYTTE